MKDIKSRGRLIYSMKDIIAYFLHCLCIRRVKAWSNKFALRKHLLYKRG
jgi:hypothetical protein